jgi:hypothetical protein
VVVPASPGEQPLEVTTGALLGVVIKDRIPLGVFKSGKPKGDRLPAASLNDMVRAELFLTRFRPLDRVADRPEFYGDFRLTRTGFNDGGDGHRVYYPGPEPEVLRSRDAVDRFLDVMAFASNADRTNAVAAALTVLLRHYWPGEKPVVLITSTKSHGGKDTVLDFARGETRAASVSYDPADWAVQKACVAALKGDPRVGLLNVANVRLDGRGREIASAFLEWSVMDAEPVLHAPGTGRDVRRPNHWVVGMTTNCGTVSKDIMNRALPVHLIPSGDVAGRTSKIGNPRHEYLPANRGRIAAELRGMVVRWKEAGSPLGNSGLHPMTGWAQVVGGILEVSGYADFLANYPARLTADDPVRAALAVLGTELPAPGAWMSAAYLAGAVSELGLTGRLIPKDDRESPASRQRALAKVLDAHAEETFVAGTGDGTVRLRLERRKTPDGGGRVVTVYRFAELGTVTG